MTRQVAFDLAWVAAVLGFFTPLLISLIKRVHWSRAIKQAVSLTVSAVVGVVNVGVQAGWSYGSVGEFLTLAVLSVIDVYVVASVVYRNFWEATPVNEALEQV